MEELYAKVTEWPVIVQGLFSSAIFAAIMFFGGKVARWLVAWSAHFSRTERKSLAQLDWMRHYSVLNEDSSESTQAIAVLVYSWLGYATKGFIAVVLGQLLDSFIPFFSDLGYLVGLYYLFWAFLCVRDVSTSDRERLEDRLAELQAEIVKLKVEK